MNKWRIAVGIALSSTLMIGTASVPTTQAAVKQHAISSSFAKSLKQGKLPSTKGSIGTKYSTLKKKATLYSANFDSTYKFYMHERKLGNYDLYAFTRKKFSKTSTVQMMAREYTYVISHKSMQKYFGKPYKTSKDDKIYKTGKYYTLVANDLDDRNTYMYVGTKKAILWVWD